MNLRRKIPDNSPNKHPNITIGTILKALRYFTVVKILTISLENIEITKIKNTDNWKRKLKKFLISSLILFSCISNLLDISGFIELARGLAKAL